MIEDFKINCLYICIFLFLSKCEDVYCTNKIISIYQFIYFFINKMWVEISICQTNKGYKVATLKRKYNLKKKNRWDESDYIAYNKSSATLITCLTSFSNH